MFLSPIGLSSIMDINWRAIQNPIYGWIKTIEKVVNSEKLPSMNGSLINIFSDYSGENKESKYETFTVLYVDVESSDSWELKRRIIREKYLLNGRRMAFKNLNDKLRQKALLPFLSAANEINGVCVTFIIKKTIKHLCSNDKLFNKTINSINFESNLTNKTFERMLRIINFITILIAGLSKPNQHIYWISDEDNLFANLKVTTDLKTLLEKNCSFYIKHNLGELGLGTTSIDTGDRYEEDLASITDLVAGAVSEVVNKVSDKSGGKIYPNIAVPFNDKFTPKTEIIYSWLRGDSYNLKKFTILFEHYGSGQIAVSRFGTT